jgi:hypothetical protein
MSVVPASIKAPVEPQVNLLPPEVVARRARGRRRGLVLLGFVAFIVLAGVSVYLASAQNASAQREWQQAVDAGQELQRQIGTYQYVLDAQAELANASSARTYVGAFDILWTDMVDRIGDGIPAGVAIDSLTITPAGIFGVPEQQLPPFGAPDIGSVELSGVLLPYVTGADLEEALNGVPGLARARVSTEVLEDTNGIAYYTFTATTRLTALAFSGRFSPEWIQRVHREDATQAFDDILSIANGKLLQAQLNAENGVEGGQAALEEATTAVEAARAEIYRFDAIIRTIEGADQSVSDFKDAVAAGEADAQAALDAAQMARDTLAYSVDALVEVVRAWSYAQATEVLQEQRVTAAEQWLSDATDAVAAAEAAVEEGTPGADDDLRDAESDQFNAQASVDQEKAALTEVQARTLEARTAVDDAFTAAEAAVDVYNAGGETS